MTCSPLHPSRLLALTALCVFVTAHGTPSNAADRKSFQGIMCTPADDIVFLTHGVLRNNASSARSVVCPVLRDNVASSDEPEWLDMWVVDQHSTEDVECTFTSSEGDGSVVTTDTQSSSGSGATLQYLFWEDPDTVAEGYYHFDCTIPGSNPFMGGPSEIVSYRINEQ